MISLGVMVTQSVLTLLEFHCVAVVFVHNDGGFLQTVHGHSADLSDKMLAIDP